MGLDIHLATENPEDIFNSTDYLDLYFYKHSLSRTFCWFISRRDVIASGEPELDQIGRITGVDISPLYEMNNYPEEEELNFFLDAANTEEEKQDLLRRAENNKAKLRGNLDRVYYVINALISKLNAIDNLPERLAPTTWDNLNNAVYFSDFGLDKGDGYINNNFGQDLRNFRDYLEHVKSKGKTTVYFSYG